MKSTSSLGYLTLVVIASIASACFSGCTTRTISYNGATYKSVRFANKETIGGVTITTPDGTTFKMDTYTSDQVQAVGAIAEGVAKGLAASVKP